MCRDREVDQQATTDVGRYTEKREERERWREVTVIGPFDGFR